MSIVAPVFFYKRSGRFPVTVRPIVADVGIARAIARRTSPAPEKVARLLTWGADEKLLLVFAGTHWIDTRGKSEPVRRAGNHALLVTVAARRRGATSVKNEDSSPSRRTFLSDPHH